MKKICLFLMILFIMPIQHIHADETNQTNEYVNNAEPGITPEKFFYFGDIFFEDLGMSLKTNKGKVVASLNIIEEREKEIDYLISAGFTSRIASTFSRLTQKIDYLNDVYIQTLEKGNDFSELNTRIIAVLSNIPKDYKSYISNEQMIELQNAILNTMIILNTLPEYLDNAIRYTGEYNNYEILYLSHIKQYYKKDLNFYMKDNDGNYIPYSQFESKYGIDLYFINEIAKFNHFYSGYSNLIESTVEENNTLINKNTEITELFNLYKFADGRTLSNSLCMDDNFVYNLMKNNRYINSELKTSLILKHDEDVTLDDLTTHYLDYYKNALMKGYLNSVSFMNSNYLQGKMLNDVDMSEVMSKIYFTSNNGIFLYNEIVETFKNLKQCCDLGYWDNRLIDQFISDFTTSYNNQDYYMMNEIINGKYYKYLFDMLDVKTRPDIMYIDFSKMHNDAFINSLSNYEQNYYRAAVVYFNYMNFDDAINMQELFRSYRLEGLEFVRSAIFNDPSITSAIRSKFLEYYELAKNNIQEDKPITVDDLPLYSDIISLINDKMIQAYKDVGNIDIINNDYQELYDFDIEYDVIKKYEYENLDFSDGAKEMIQNYFVYQYGESKYLKNYIDNMLLYLGDEYQPQELDNRLNNIDRYLNYKDYFDGISDDMASDMTRILTSAGYNYDENQMNQLFEYVLYMYDKHLNTDLLGVTTDSYISGLNSLYKSYLQINNYIRIQRGDILKEEFTETELAHNEYLVNSFTNKFKNLIYSNELLSKRTISLYQADMEWNYLLLSNKITHYILDDDLSNQYYNLYDQYESIFD